MKYNLNLKQRELDAFDEFIKDFYEVRSLWGCEKWVTAIALLNLS